jgi:succinate-semialdehyde dehydrogenase/glutarate-semialdehyde dehydrogenase
LEEQLMACQSLNPATGKLLKKFDERFDEQLYERLATAAECFETWRRKSDAERAVIVAKAAALMHDQVEHLKRNSGYGRELGDLGSRNL